jgi:hypothetical protein
MRTSLYADDVALFIKPTASDIRNVQLILAAFGEATGLHMNMNKSAMYMIQAQEVDMVQLTPLFRGTVDQLPTKYLGLPLYIGKTRRIDEQLLFDKIGARLPGWKGRLLTRAGRLTLVNFVLTSIPVYYMTSFPLSKWAIKRIDAFAVTSYGKDMTTRGGDTVQSIGARFAELSDWGARHQRLVVFQ